LSKLNEKAGINTNIQPQLYKSHVYYGSTNNYWKYIKIWNFL